ncbi:MAG: endonuclease, partial [Muribaculaceae bacterium]|nr:endonuclease [Muribaculaceae bacterium]
ARLAPVSQKEILRNAAVEVSQGNRNPFVDFPELAEYIWGTRTTEVFRIEEQGGAVTPPITGEPALTLPVNDEWLDFGEVAVNGSGSAWLVLKGGNFTAPLSVRVGGEHKDMFTLATRTISASAINTTGEYNLPILYTPTETGQHTATLSIYDGGMASSVRVNLRGRALEAPQLSQLTAMSPMDVTPTAYTAVWTEAQEPVDYYVLYRTRYYADGEETDALESATNSLRITDRDPGVAESYSVCSSRLGYLSPRSNQVMVEVSGVAGIDDEETLRIGTLPGGIRILTSQSAVDIEIFDAAGRSAGSHRGLSHGDSLELPKGIYIVKSPALASPQLIIL